MTRVCCINSMGKGREDSNVLWELRLWTDLCKLLLLRERGTERDAIFGCICGSNITGRLSATYLKEKVILQHSLRCTHTIHPTFLMTSSRAVKLKNTKRLSSSLAKKGCSPSIRIAEEPQI